MMCAFIILNFIVWGGQGGEGVVYIDASDMRFCKNYFNNLSLQSFVLRCNHTPDDVQIYMQNKYRSRAVRNSQHPVCIFATTQLDLPLKGLLT